MPDSLRPVIPPIKCQGIKTRLIPFIDEALDWDRHGNGRWIEPLLGSGVVLFSLRPERANVSDNNPHIIDFYQAIQSAQITSQIVRDHLERNGALLRTHGESHYYAVRERFNADHDPLDFLFLSRSCFNGLMRFNRRGDFNVSFCRKPERFSKAYVTKIVHQVERVASIIHGRDWVFSCTDFRNTLRSAGADDLLYLDPPYLGRHSDYRTTWTPQDAEDLARMAHESPAGYALSMWRENRYRRNEHLDTFWAHDDSVDFQHFYHIGSSTSLRADMTETLIIKPGFLARSLTIVT